MSKSLSNAKYKEFIKSLPVDKQFESVERSLRVLPQEIMDEVAPVPTFPCSSKLPPKASEASISKEKFPNCKWKGCVMEDILGDIDILKKRVNVH